MILSSGEKQLRLSALDIALRQVGGSANTNELLDRARKIYEFLTGSDEPKKGDHNGTR